MGEIESRNIWVFLSESEISELKFLKVDKFYNIASFRMW